MTSQILIKQDFDNYSEKFSFARRRFFLAELISTGICHLLLDVDTADDDDLDIHEE